MEKTTIAATMAVLVGIILVGAVLVPVIDYQTKETTTIMNEGAGDLRYVYNAEPVDYSSTINYNDVSDEIVTGFGSADLQTIAAVESIIWASDIGAVVFNGSTFYLVADDGETAVNTDLGDGFTVTVSEGVVTISDSEDTVYSGAITWSYAPQKNGVFGFFTDSGATVNDFPVAAAGSFAGAYAYNSINSLGHSTLSPTYSVTDGVFTTGPWVVPDLNAKSKTVKELPTIEEKTDEKKEAATKSVVDPSTGTQIGDLYYKFSGSEATVLGISSAISSATSIVIPDTVTSGGTTYNVTAIAAPNSYSGVFGGLTSLESVTLPENLVRIGNFTFSGCTNLALTSLPDGVTTIDYNAFKNCTSLALTSLPDGVTTIGDSAFLGCTSLALTSLPDGVTAIGNDVFYGCTNLALTSLPDGVTTIGNQAFRDCTSLALTSLPDGVTAIGAHAFTGSNLSSMRLPDSVTTVGGGAFRDSPLNDFIVLGSPSIGSSVFSGTGIQEFLNLGTTSITAGSYGLPVDVVVSDEIASLGYLAPVSFSETVVKTGAEYTLMLVIPIIVIAGILMASAVMFGLTRRNDL